MLSPNFTVRQAAPTTLGRVFQRCIDPDAGDLQGRPGEERDIAIYASNTFLLAYDNISHLEPALADILCRVSAGGGFRTEALYSDDEEKLFKFIQPVILTGVDEVVTRTDLLDRTVSTILLKGTDDQEETLFWRMFNEARPTILGALSPDHQQGNGALARDTRRGQTVATHGELFPDRTRHQSGDG